MFLNKNLLCGLFMASSFSWGVKAQEKPNVILIMADDLGWGDTGYNGNKVIKTPNLDKMAQEGVKFNRFYSASAVCSPTRASVLTGRNPFRTGVFYANKGVLRKEEQTLAEVLKEQGYTTGHFGKWHLGTLTISEKDANRGCMENKAEYNPPAWHGYDNAFVTESKVPTWDPMKKPMVGAKREGWNYIKEGEKSKPFGTSYWNIKGNKVTENLSGDDSRIVMDRVIPFIDKAKNNKDPFLAVVWFHSPHMPCVAGPKYAAMYKDQDQNMMNYAGCITAMDEQIGRLRDYLKQQGMSENTMIWFCSDNGPEVGSPGTADIFKDRKRSFYEGGIRVPGLLVWPSKVNRAFETDVACNTSDYFPTIVEALDLDQKIVKNELDGVSLIPLLEGRKIHRKDQMNFAIKEQLASMNGKYKLYARKGEYELYNVYDDPSEVNDLSKRKRSKVKKMARNYQLWLARCKSSFEGKEYGTESYNLLQQNWVDPLKPVKRKNK